MMKINRICWCIASWAEYLYENWSNLIMDGEGKYHGVNRLNLVVHRKFKYENRANLVMYSKANYWVKKVRQNVRID